MTATGARNPAPRREISPAGQIQQRATSGSSLTVEQFCWGIVLLIAAGMRLLALGQPPLDRAEGVRALASWTVAHGRVQDSWPGGIVDAFTALVFRLVGSSDAIARLGPALAGLALVVSFWLLRPFLGRTAALAAALLAALSPLFIYDSRTVGGASAGAAAAISLCALTLHVLSHPRPRLLLLLCVLLAVGLGTDAVFLGSLLILTGWLALRGAWLRSPDVMNAWSVARRDRGWLIDAAAPTLAGTLLVVSRFGTGFARLRPAVAASWSDAFAPSRSGVAWHYPLDALAGYGAGLLVLGAAGAYLVYRERSWREAPLHGLAVFWLAAGLSLNLFMAGRYPSTLLLTLLPLTILAGHAVERGLLSVRESLPAMIDLVLAAGLLIVCLYLAIVATSFVNGGATSALQLWAGVLLVAICLGGATVRWRQGGIGAALPVIAVVALVGVAVDLRGAGAVRGNGDEFLAGQRSTEEGKAFARLLVSNGGGVSSVTDMALPPLAWYLRDTIRSGGHGSARLIPAETQIPAGFHGAGETAVISRTWVPASLSALGMIRWWIYRQSWGRSDEISVRLVVVD